MGYYDLKFSLAPVDRREMSKPSRISFDPIYGFIELTETENKIIHSPYYQRLRWIKQLGFSNYIFPGAEHTRFSHAMGVMHMADKMLRALDLGVSNEKLYNPKVLDKKTTFHKSVRVAALLHDIGTFPFSHTCESAYIRYGEKHPSSKKINKKLPNTHEHLGAYILKHSKEKNGITSILKEAGLDPNEISKIIKGESKSILANQLLHSEVDADRMDYLIRDAHYTGVKYGHFDRDYILSQLRTFQSGKGKLSLGIGESALHAVEDFLISRFSWYSQVVRGSSGAKFDIIAQLITAYFLKEKIILSFDDLLSLVGRDSHKFFGFNDFYFMNLIQREYSKSTAKKSHIQEMMHMILYRDSPIELNAPILSQKLLPVGKKGLQERENIVKKIKKLKSHFEDIIRNKGSGLEWIICDIPSTDISFAKNLNSIMESAVSKNLLLERDPVKIINSRGEATLLVENKHSVIHILANIRNFIPSFYVNQAAYKLLKKHGELALLEKEIA